MKMLLARLDATNRFVEKYINSVKNAFSVIVQIYAVAW